MTRAGGDARAYIGDLVNGNGQECSLYTFRLNSAAAARGRGPRATLFYNHACFMALLNFWAGRVLSTSSLVSQARRAWRMP